jgi:hypothetical protein
MHFSIRLAVAAGLGLAATAVLAQDNAALIFDPTQKTNICMVIDITQTIGPPANPLACISNGNNLLPYFLVQGQRKQMRVFRRRFLTNYSFFVYHVTDIQNFAIEDLHSAANLTTPLSSSTAGVSKGAAPKGLATNGALQPRTAQDLIAELINPATATNPAAEIASDWLVVKREVENVRNDARSFQATWLGIWGATPPPNVQGCPPTDQTPQLTFVRACLRGLNDRATSGNFDPALTTYGDQDGFQRLTTQANDAIATVSLMGNTLALQTPLLANQLSAFDGDLAALRADMNTLGGNAQAMTDAIVLLQSITPRMTKAQIRARLSQQLNSGSKPLLDDAELTDLTEEYYRFTQTEAGKDAISNSLSKFNHVWYGEILPSATRLIASLGGTPCPVDEFEAKSVTFECPANKIDAILSDLLEQDQMQLNGDLPDLVAAINSGQSTLLARINQIYDDSQIAIPLDVPITLKKSGNLALSFTIYETETFPRFKIPSSAAGSSLFPGSPATVTIPTPPTTTTATTTTTTSATTTTTTTDTPSGSPVMSGMVEQHARYRATMVAAFAFSPGLKEFSIQTNSITTGTATGSTTANPILCSPTTPCTQVTTSPGPAHSSVIFGMSFHPLTYDTFRGVYSWGRRPGQALAHGLGIFGGLSVQNLNDYYAGLDLQIAYGLQVMGGANFYRQNTLAAGFTSGGIYPGTPTFTGAQQWTHGAYFGIGLNLSIFRKAFGTVTGLGATAATGGS